MRGGGAEKVGVLLGKYFSSMNVESHYFLMKKEGVFLEDVDFSSGVVDMNVGRIRDLRSYLKKNSFRDYDCVIANMWPLTFVAGLWLRVYGYRGRVILVEHANLVAQYSDKGGLFKFGMYGSMALASMLADRIVAVSQGLRNRLAKIPFICNKRLITIHNPVHLDARQGYFRSGSERIKSVLHSSVEFRSRGGKIVTIVGGLRREKNHMLALEVILRCKESGIPIMLWIVGEGPLEYMLKVRVGELGLSKNVVFFGFQRGLQEIYKNTDVVLVTSTFEGFCNVIAESLMCGTPVVSVDCEYGPSEIIRQGVSGMVVKNNSVEDLSATLAAAFSHPWIIEEIKDSVRHFAPDVVGDIYLREIRR